MKRKRDIEIAKSFAKKPCQVCGIQAGTVGHHIKSFGSGGPCTEANMWSLCPNHHAEVHMKGLNTFVEKYPRLKHSLKEKGWAFDSMLNKWIMIQ